MQFEDNSVYGFIIKAFQHSNTRSVLFDVKITSLAQMLLNALMVVALSLNRE